MALLIVKSGTQSGQTFDLRTGLNRIGRHPENDLVLVDPHVSLFHGEIRVSDIAVVFRDLISTNGTYVNQQRFLKGVLPQRCLIRLGVVEMELHVDTAHIAIPQQEVALGPEPAFLDDGSAACFVHRVVPASLACAKCGNTYCHECARWVGLSGREAKAFCPECSGPCLPFAAAPVVEENKLLNTVRILQKRISYAFRPKRRR